jgi:protein-disulfide isomerase
VLRFYLLAATVLAGGVGGLATHLLTGSTRLSPDQKREVQEVVHGFMKENNEAPALVANALQAYAQQQEEVQIKETQGRMDAERERLLDKNTAIVVGNPEAKTKLIVFYDNNCSHCRATDLQLQKLLEKNKDLAIVYRQYPILGKRSEEVAAGVIAVAKYNKFPEINHAIAQSDKPLTLDLLIEMAQVEGVTGQQIKDGMASAEIQAVLKENRALGEKIGFQMTPTVILVTEKDLKLLQELDEESLAKILPAA